MDDIRDCFRILDLEPGASFEDVKRSYRELVRVWHPDRFRSDPKLQAKAEEKLKQINLAYERLCKEAAAEGSHKAAATKTKAATNPAPERTRPEDEATHVPPVKDPSSTNEPENVHLTRWIWMAAAVVALLIIAVTHSEKPQESGNSARVQLPTPPEQVAAEQGDAVAQRILGDMYAEGSGVVQDEAKAVEWFRKAATQGDSDAQRRLGQMYAEGRGVPKDEAKAEEWFQKSEPSEPSEEPMEKIFSKMPRVNSPTIDVIQTTSTAYTFKVAPQQVSVKVNAKTFLEAKTEASQQSQRLATAKYPDLKNKASSFHAKFTELYGAAKSDGKGLLDDPNWPMVVADMAATALRAYDTLNFGDSKEVVIGKLKQSTRLKPYDTETIRAKPDEIDGAYYLDVNGEAFKAYFTFYKSELAEVAFCSPPADIFAYNGRVEVAWKARSGILLFYDLVSLRSHGAFQIV